MGFKLNIESGFDAPMQRLYCSLGRGMVIGCLRECQVFLVRFLQAVNFQIAKNDKYNSPGPQLGE